MPKKREKVTTKEGRLLFGVCPECNKHLSIIRTTVTPTAVLRVKLCYVCSKTNLSTIEVSQDRFDELLMVEKLYRALSSPPTPPEQRTPTPTVLPEEVTLQEKPLYDEYNNPLNEAARAEQDKYDQQLADEMADYEEEQARQANP